VRGARISPGLDCFGKKFGFCSGDTAKIQNLAVFVRKSSNIFSQ